MRYSNNKTILMYVLFNCEKLLLHLLNHLCNSMSNTGPIHWPDNNTSYLLLNILIKSSSNTGCLMLQKTECYVAVRKWRTVVHAPNTSMYEGRVVTTRNRLTICAVTHYRETLVEWPFHRLLMNWSKLQLNLPCLFSSESGLVQ